MCVKLWVYLPTDERANFLLRGICFLYYFEKGKPFGHPHI
jgi:hypothetical protein